MTSGVDKHFFIILPDCLLQAPECEKYCLCHSDVTSTWLAALLGASWVSRHTGHVNKITSILSSLCRTTHSTRLLLPRVCPWRGLHRGVYSFSFCILNNLYKMTHHLCPQPGAVVQTFQQSSVLDRSRVTCEECWTESWCCCRYGRFSVGHPEVLPVLSRARHLSRLVLPGWCFVCKPCDPGKKNQGVGPEKAATCTSCSWQPS